MQPKDCNREWTAPDSSPRGSGKSNRHPHQSVPSCMGDQGDWLNPAPPAPWGLRGAASLHSSIPRSTAPAVHPPKPPSPMGNFKTRDRKSQSLNKLGFCNFRSKTLLPVSWGTWQGSQWDVEATVSLQEAPRPAWLSSLPGGEGRMFSGGEMGG